MKIALLFTLIGTIVSLSETGSISAPSWLRAFRGSA